MCELALTKAQSEKRKVKSAKWKAQSEKWKRKAKARFNAPQFFQALSKKFSGKDGSAPPIKKLARTPMRLYAGKPSQNVTADLGQLSLPSLRGRKWSTGRPGRC